MKVEIFCLVRKKNIIVNSALANALVKMKRAVHIENATKNYETKIMVADVTPETYKKKRGRKKKEL